MSLAKTASRVAVVATAATAAAFSSSATVPQHLHPSPYLRDFNFLSTVLRPVTLTTDGVTQLPLAAAGEDERSAKGVISKYVQDGGGIGSVCFVIRRPG